MLALCLNRLGADFGYRFAAIGYGFSAVLQEEFSGLRSGFVSILTASGMARSKASALKKDLEMPNNLRSVLAAAAFIAAGLAHSNASAQSNPDASAQSNLRERIAAAIEMIEGACATDVKSFCGNVTRDEGRLVPCVLCMQAYDDQLSKRCQFALYRVSRNLGSVPSRVDRIADACWNDIQVKCGDADKIGQCVMERHTSLSQPCQTVINDLRQAYQGPGSLEGAARTRLR